MLPLAVALPLLAAAILGWACYRIAIQNGRLLLRIEALEQAVSVRSALLDMDGLPGPALDSDRTAGLALGTVGNDFDLPDLRGGRGTLSDQLGSSVLLVFIDPDCPHSRELLIQLAPLSRRPDGGTPLLLLISTGSVDENLAIVAPLGLRASVLLQEDWEAGELYWVQATPAAYLLDERGAVASHLALGAPAVLELAQAGHHPGGRSPAPFSAAQATPRRSRVPLGQAVPLVAFQPGALVPDFRLPRLGGGEAGPADFLGRPLLLVFTDPSCPACDALLPQIEAAHRREPAPALLIVSRQDQQMDEGGAPAPAPDYAIVVQHGWEVSLRFGVLATPAAYLIDKTGTIAAGPAIGADAVRQLLSQADAEPQRQGDAVR